MSTEKKKEEFIKYLKARMKDNIHSLNKIMENGIDKSAVVLIKDDDKIFVHLAQLKDGEITLINKNKKEENFSKDEFFNNFLNNGNVIGAYAKNSKLAEEINLKIKELGFYVAITNSGDLKDFIKSKKQNNNSVVDTKKTKKHSRFNK